MNTEKPEPPEGYRRLEGDEYKYPLPEGAMMQQGGGWVHSQIVGEIPNPHRDYIIPNATRTPIPSPEHNPDGLSPEQYGAPEWRLLRKGEPLSLDDQMTWAGTGKWHRCYEDQLRLQWQSPEITYRRRVTPIPSPEHNPDGLTPEQYGAPEFRLLQTCESVRWSDEFNSSSGLWETVGSRNQGDAECGAIYPWFTYRRRVTPIPATGGEKCPHGFPDSFNESANDGTGAPCPECLKILKASKTPPAAQGEKGSWFYAKDRDADSWTYAGETRQEAITAGLDAYGGEPDGFYVTTGHKSRYGHDDDHDPEEFEYTMDSVEPERIAPPAQGEKGEQFQKGGDEPCATITTSNAPVIPSNPDTAIPGAHNTVVASNAPVDVQSVDQGQAPPCFNCRGSGQVGGGRDPLEVCWVCEGSGFYSAPAAPPAAQGESICKTCQSEMSLVCDPTGQHDYYHCFKCAAQGEKDAETGYDRLKAYKDTLVERENEKLRAEGRKSVILLRCTECLTIPQQNSNEFTGGECGGCIAKQLATVRAESAAKDAIIEGLRKELHDVRSVCTEALSALYEGELVYKPRKDSNYWRWETTGEGLAVIEWDVTTPLTDEQRAALARAEEAVKEGK